MKRVFAIFIMFTATALFAQNPQSQGPIFAANAKYVNGVAPGYAPTQGAGLALNVGPGGANCTGTIANYTGGSFALTANATNYVYLNTASSCVPSVKLVTFTATDIPIAIVVTNGSAITSLMDVRTEFTAPTTGGGGGGAVGAVGNIQASNGSGSNESSPNVKINTTSNTIQLLNGSSVVATGPKVDVTSDQFGTAAGCANNADPTGTLDSTCAIQAAITYRNAYVTAHPNLGSPVIYIPLGNYTVGTGNTGTTAVFTLKYGTEVLGDGNTATQINSLATHATTMLFNGINGSCNFTLQCQTVLRGVSLYGVGHLGNATAIEVFNIQNTMMDHIVIANYGGIGISLNGSTERSSFEDIDINNTQRPVVMEGDTNENYFRRVNPLFDGSDVSGYCFSVVNCTNGVPTTGKRSPDYRPLVQIDGVNIHWEDSSVKGVNIFSGIRIVSGEAITVQNTYVEGFTPGSNNVAIQIQGASELGHTTSAMTTTSLRAAVDDAIWQPLYVADPSLATALGNHAYVNGYVIYPPDYVSGDTTDLSSLCSGVSGCTIYKGTTELVDMGSFNSDGSFTIYSNGRGESGTIAQAWPAGAVISQRGNSTYAGINLINVHTEANYDTAASTNNCDDYAIKATPWIGSNREVCKEIIVGPVPDGFYNPFPSSTAYSTVATSVTFNGVSQYTAQPDSATTEQYGSGWIGVPSSGSINMLSESAALQTTQTYPASSEMFNNTYAHVAYFQYTGRTALGELIDQQWGIDDEPSSPYYEQKVRPGNSSNLEDVIIGSKCWDIQPNDSSGTPTAQPLRRTCQFANGLYQQTFTNGAWVTIPPTATVTVVNGSGTIPSGYSDVYLFNNLSGATAAVILPVCSSTVNNSAYMNIYRADPNTNDLTVITAPSGTNFSIDGVLTGSSTTSALYMPNGANWRAVCAPNINGNTTWAIYSNQSGFGYPHMTLNSSQAGSVTFANFTATSLSGQVALTLTTAAPAYSALYSFTNSSPGYIQYNAAFVQSEATQTTPSIQFGTGYFTTTGNTYTVFAPAAGLPAGSYTLQYLNRTF
jgi:hypothetical protein